MYIADPAGDLFVLIFISATVHAKSAAEGLQWNHSEITCTACSVNNILSHAHRTLARDSNV
jgi:hypothetical protein